MNDVFFKGYVPTKDKKCTMSFRDKKSAELLTFDQVELMKEYAGILDDETILIDVDDKEQSEILLNIVEAKNLLCRVYETTRGMHFLFKRGEVDRCGTHKKTAIGIECDIKVGNKNSYEVLKFNGKERPILYDILPGEEYQELPKWLTVVNARDVAFLNMETGDGRNQALFNYILTLQANGFSIEDTREVIRIINEYILVDPLPVEEIETILRDDAFKKPVFYDKTTFLFDKFATFLKNECHIIRLYGNLYLYDNGVYISGKNAIMAKMIKYIPRLKATQRREVLDYLDLIVEAKRNFDNSNYIAFNNGLYDIVNNEIVDFTPEIIVTNKIDFDYVPNAKSEILERTLNNIACQDPNIRSLLEEMAGYVLFRRNELRKCFILTGDKKNGKSTWLDLLTQMLGEDNISSLDLADIGGQFRTAELVGKLANIGDDIGDEFIKNPSIFKKVVSGDRITTEHKGQDPFAFNNYSKLLFSANDIPRIKDRSGAVLDRLIIVPFNARFDKNNPDFDPFIKYKLHKPEVIEALIQLALRGLKRVLQNQGFTVNEAVQKELEEYEENNNPILLFFKETGEDNIINERTTECYRNYREFCVANSFNPMSQIEFSRTVKRSFNCEIVEQKINGNRYRVFIKN